MPKPKKILDDISTVWLHATMMQLTLVFWTLAGELSVTYARRLLPSFEACSMTAHTKNWVPLSIKKAIISGQPGSTSSFEVLIIPPWLVAIGRSKHHVSNLGDPCSDQLFRIPKV